MRKRIKLHKNIMIKSTAFLMMLCMIIGSTYIPAFAEEEDKSKLSTLESGDSIPDDLENKDSENKEDQSEDSKDNTETKDNTQDEKEPDSDDDTDEKEPETDGDIDEKEPETGEDADGEAPEGESPKDDDKKVSDNDVKEKEFKEEKESKKQETPEIINVLVPSAYILALNPYGLSIRIGEEEVTTEQVISGNYGIVNKSSTDQIVTVSLTVEDMNEGELVFVDSAEEARNAEEGVYAVYLAAVPADQGEILVDGSPVDENTIGEALQNVKMTGAQEQAVTLYSGTNQIAFKLSGAVYSLEDDEEAESDDLTDDLDREPEMIFEGLAPDGSGMTAYTFCGAMNPNAAWEKLSGGIRLSVVYTYQTADGSEEVIEGTGAMIYID